MATGKLQQKATMCCKDLLRSWQKHFPPIADKMEMDSLWEKCWKMRHLSFLCDKSDVVAPNPQGAKSPKEKRKGGTKINIEIFERDSFTLDILNKAACIKYS